MMMKLIRKEERNWLDHWLRRNCLLEEALEGMVNGRIVRGRKRCHMIDDIKRYGSYEETKRKAENWKDWRKLVLLFNAAISTTRLFSVNEIGDSELELARRDRGFAIDYQAFTLQLGKTSEKNPTSRVRSNRIRNNCIRSSHVRSNHIRSSRVRSNHIRNNRIPSGHVRSSHIRKIIFVAFVFAAIIFAKSYSLQSCTQESYSQQLFSYNHVRSNHIRKIIFVAVVFAAIIFATIVFLAVYISGCLVSECNEGDNADEMSPESSTDSYPTFVHVGLRENLGKISTSRTHRHDTTVHDVIRRLIPALYKNQSDSLMAVDGDCHHLCKLMTPVRHRWSINDVIGGIRNTVMSSDCSPVRFGIRSVDALCTRDQGRALLP
ncbi:hypothetical protein ANN_24407 [Periplaneta americana]|uniref:Uncharacterized protein n=1 Tax=Periplaneta americana TaxID=6978 RepID=A0ABQ8S3C2_PERAM|nr:hypothetical protein ANN_24407 [Periplaneta americana]